MNVENTDIKKRPLVYVAGPYAHPDPVENTHNAVNAGMELYETGKVAVLVPHITLAMHMINPRPEDYWYTFDLHQVAHCSAVFRIPGKSTGSDEEVRFAEERGIPVFHDKDELLAWADEWTEEG